jgi:hypothetical protein
MFFTEQTWLGQTLWVLLFFIFIIIYPKYILYKMIADMEEMAETLEGYTRDAVDLIVKVSKERGKPAIEPKEVVENAMDFFLIPPVDLDPYGILVKVEHLVDKTEDRLEAIAEKIAPESDEIWRANIISLVKGGIGLNNIAKLVRHFVEFVKKTNNLQMAMIMQMQLPIIKKIAKAQKKGVETIAEGKPIGDGIAPLVAANMIKEDKAYEVAKDVICHESSVNGRKVFILKADGPGARLGKLGDAVKKVCENERIVKIITVDASVKLEGEKTGKVCEGIGAAIGDPGPEKAKMEEIATKNGIPLEAFVIKMSIEEAISPLTKDIGESVPKAIDLITDGIERAPEGSSVLVVGVGNTCGIGNSYSSIKNLKLPEREKEEEEIPAIDKFIRTMVKKPKKPVERPKEKPKKKAKG